VHHGARGDFYAEQMHSTEAGKICTRGFPSQLVKVIPESASVGFVTSSVENRELISRYGL
jgi:hypothetical protein